MKQKKNRQPTKFQIGDIVKVRNGFKDPDTKVDMSDWHGRITEFYPEVGTALIVFDSITLQNLPLDYIDQSDEEGVSWSEYGYDLADLTRVEPRDTTADVEKIIEQIENRYAHNFLYMGEEGREIQRIMQAIDPEGEMSPLYVWAEYLEQKLTFPFEAVVDEWQERGPLRSGDKVRVHAIEDADEHYGIIVKLRRGRQQFHMPLCDLAATDTDSPIHDLIDLYRTWFANR